jgi:hypothetical protein
MPSPASSPSPPPTLFLSTRTLHMAALTCSSVCVHSCNDAPNNDPALCTDLEGGLPAERCVAGWEPTGAVGCTCTSLLLWPQRDAVAALVALCFARDVVLHRGHPAAGPGVPPLPPQCVLLLL